MHHLPARIMHTATQLFLSILAFSLVVFAFIQLGCIIALSLLNTPPGRAFIHTQLNALTAETGQRIEIGGIYYDPVRGLSVQDITLSDQAGVLISLDHISLRVAFEKLMARQLDLALIGGQLIIHRLPPASEETPAQNPEHNAPLSPFTLPDIYIRGITAYMGFNQVTLAENILGQDLSLKPDARIAVKVTDRLAVDAQFNLAPAQINDIPLPQTIAATFSLDPQTLQLVLDKAYISASAYQLDAKGAGTFLSPSSLDYTLDAAYHDLTALTGGNFQQASLNAGITGSLERPIVQMDGRLVPASLSAKGLEDIVFSITPDLESPISKALVKIESRFRDAPILATTHVAYQKPDIQIESLNIQAPYIAASGHALIDTGTALADGELEANLLDISHYKDLIGQNISGAILAKLTAAPQDGKQSLSLDTLIKNFRFDDISAQQIAVKAFLPTLDNPWPHSADIKANNLTITPDLFINQADILLTRQQENIYALSVNGQGKMPASFTLRGQSTLSDFDGPFPTAKEIALTLKTGTSSVQVTGQVTPQLVDLNAQTQNFKLSDAPVALPDTLSSGRLSAAITLNGPPASPATKADITLSDLRTGEYKGLSVNMQADHADNTAHITINGTGSGIKTLQADASIPLAFSLYPFSFILDQQAALTGRFNTDLDISPVAALFLPPTQIVQGKLIGSGTIAGTLAKPDLNGTARLSEGYYKNMDAGIDIHDIIASAAFDMDKITLNSLSAGDGESGTITGRGNIGLSPAYKTDVTLTAHHFHIPKEGMADGYISADLVLRDQQDAYALNGTVNIEEMAVQIPERFQSNIPQLNIVKKEDGTQNDTAKSISLDIAVSADNQIFVRGWGLDAEFGGDITVSGDLSAPLFNGNFSARRGRYDEFGKRFELARADLRFQGTIPPSPYLDIEATTQADDVLASVLLSGSVQKPSIGFSSVPSLPEDEVLARILFGKSAAKISPFQAVQLAQTLQRFSGKGGGGLDPLGMLRDLTGLDDISVDTDEAGETSVGVGKYLTDKVYLEFERGKAENSGAASLQVEVTPSIKLETEVGQDARAGGGVFWSHDY